MILLKYIQSNSPYLCLGVLLISCTSNPKFIKVESSTSGIQFKNEINATADLNIFNYLYFFNGGGAATGDLNGDGLPDLVFTSNMGANGLYVNLGDFKFIDLSERIAETERTHKWTTGVSFADINGDGKLDIYINEVGSYLKIEGENKLWINQGNDASGYPIFSEDAKRYGLDVVGFCTQTAFFDFDLDNDLDAYVLNHSVHSNGTFGSSDKRKESHPLAGDRFLENINGKFVDVTSQVGIFNSPLGYGLGITISDLNDDGYPDVYVGNDFHEDDYLYINQGNGTFRESLSEMINHTSRFSMGNDIGDVNNDGRLDIFSLDMLPSEYEILKSSAGEDAYDIYTFKLSFGYKHQHSRNTLQLNRGQDHFSEIGLISGVSATDWSWSGLLADFDMDGYNDIFIANGILGRTNDMDYINYVSNDAIQYRLEGDIGGEELMLTDKMPAVKISNAAFRNKGNLLFENVSKKWGLNEATFSNGAVYADFDGDGDLDLAINNINQEASIYKNGTIEMDNSPNYIKINVIGKAENTMGVGTRISIFLNDTTTLIRELFPVRGFQSSVDYMLHAGVGSLEIIPRIEAMHPGGFIIEMKNVLADQVITFDFSNQGSKKEEMDLSVITTFAPLEIGELGMDFVHTENNFVEFNREALIPHMVSAEGPAVAVGDINNDGLDDVFFGGSKYQRSVLYIQTTDMKFRRDSLPNDPVYEDVDAAFHDFNGDGYQDLLVVCGGNEFRGKSKYRKPRLYLNDGTGKLLIDSLWIPEVYLNASVIACADIDQDGDIDVFIGARSVPWKYGVPPESCLLENQGNGFTVKKDGLGEFMSDLGMVVDATWQDMDSNGKPDLIVAPEWASVKILYQDENEFRLYQIPESEGLWSALAIRDINNDGKPDIVAGNLGLNSKLAQNGTGTLNMYVSDFDNNETIEQIITMEVEGTEQIFADKMELDKQMVSMKKKFTSFKSFAEAEFSDVISKEQIKKATKYHVADTRSKIFYQHANGDEYISIDLPIQGQMSPIHSIMIADFNSDGLIDILTAGNFGYANIQRGVYDASYGELFLQQNNGGWEYVDQAESGIYLKGDIKNLRFVKSSQDSVLLAARNNGLTTFYRLNSKTE